MKVKNHRTNIERTKFFLEWFGRGGLYFSWYTWGAA